MKFNADVPIVEDVLYFRRMKEGKLYRRISSDNSLVYMKIASDVLIFFSETSSQPFVSSVETGHRYTEATDIKNILLTF